MPKFIIEPHFRLQEWVAEEKGYFKDEGLDYEFRELVKATDGKIHDKGDKVGAMQSFEEGRKSDVSCACHWTVNVAASKGHGKLYSDLYSVSPAGIFVAADSKIYMASEEGVVVVLDGGEELKVLARNKLDGQILATPAIVDGKIYVRTESHLYAFGR